MSESLTVRAERGKGDEMFQYPEAFWAASSAWAAWCIGAAGVLVNAIGLTFIWRQLRSGEAALRTATKSADAAAAAADAAFATSRPWLRVMVHPMGDFMPAWSGADDARYPPKIKLDISWSNIGETPAADICCFAAVVPKESQAAADNVLLEVLRQENFNSNALFPAEKDSTSREVELFEKGADQGWPVLVLLRYRTAGRSPFHYTAKVMGVLPKPDDPRFWTEESGASRQAAVRESRMIRIDPT